MTHILKAIINQKFEARIFNGMMNESEFVNDPMEFKNRIQDIIGRVSDIEFGYFNTIEECKAAAALFPKSFKPKRGLICEENDKGGYVSKYKILFQFNIHFMDKTTGDVNEAAIARRARIVKTILKTLDA